MEEATGHLMRQRPVPANESEADRLDPYGAVGGQEVMALEVEAQVVVALRWLALDAGPALLVPAIQVRHGDLFPGYHEVR